jgi:hypothetical protein
MAASPTTSACEVHWTTSFWSVACASALTNLAVRGQMLGGFALVAYPARWGNSDVMTFIVNHDGVVYQKDLGPDTAAMARSMMRFNPDSTWTRL